MILYYIKNQIKYFFAKFRKTKLKVVHDRDLPRLLESLGILNRVQKGLFHCAQCKEVITLYNLGVIFRKKNKIYLICSKQDCLAQL